jgi:hypothetical protein
LSVVHIYQVPVADSPKRGNIEVCVRPHE